MNLVESYTYNMLSCKYLTLIGRHDLTEMLTFLKNIIKCVFGYQWWQFSQIAYYSFQVDDFTIFIFFRQTAIDNRHPTSLNEFKCIDVFQLSKRSSRLIVKCYFYIPNFQSSIIVPFSLYFFFLKKNLTIWQHAPLYSILNICFNCLRTRSFTQKFISKSSKGSLAGLIALLIIPLCRFHQKSSISALKP